MAIITRSEVKTLLGLNDNYIVSESHTMSSVASQRLTNKPNVDVILVSADIVNSSVSSTNYTTNDYYTTQDAGQYEIIRRIDTGTIGDTQTIYVNYTFNDYDSQIDTLIPLVEEDLVEYLNNCFPDKDTSYQAGTIVLNDLSPPTITDTEEQFVIEGFEGNMDIALEGSYRNSGLYTVDVTAAGTLTLSSADSLLNEGTTDEYGSNTLRVTRVRWPEAIKPLVSQMIWENMDNIRAKNVQSKSLGPFSITYMAIESGGYSDHVVKGLSKWRNVKLK